ncbi:MAG: VOC family protein [Mucilaginibacter polytrichastri]|nr:VOC family protein [Mucilaginibacter polytrichastri]
MAEDSDHYPSVTPYLIVPDVNELMTFLTEVFDATIRLKHEEVGRVVHAEMNVGDSLIMMSQATEQYPALTGMYYIYLGECDKYYERAMARGAKSLRAPTNENYGHRSAGVEDSNGVQWWMAGRLVVNS